LREDCSTHNYSEQNILGLLNLRLRRIGGRYPAKMRGRSASGGYIFFAKKKQKSPPEHFRAGMPLQISEAIHEIHLKINYGIE